jgi:membrane-bound lytic murein transglycosylase MltF
VHFVTVYTRVNPKLSKWLASKGVSDDEWLKWMVRDSDSRDLSAIADELFEAATAREAFNAPVLESESYLFDGSERLDRFIEKRKLVPTLRPKKYAATELVSRFISKWFEMQDRERASDPYATSPSP